MKLVKVAKIAMLVLMLATASAALAKPGSEDFNALIEENEATQKRLSKDLQEQLKTKDLGKTEKRNFKEVGEGVLGKTSSENVVVASDPERKTKPSKSPDLERKNFNRLSQELKDVK